MVARNAFDAVPRIASEMGEPEPRVRAVVGLLRDGNTVPFIARYRKEATGALDEVAIRRIEERLRYLEDLDERRRVILDSIEQQGKLDDELRARLLACATKAELEDLYLPYRPRRRTRASMARERGLEPLAQRILAQPDTGDPRAEALAFVDAERGVGSVEEALAGARDIVAELAAERADVRAAARTLVATSGVLTSRATRDAAGRTTKYEPYYDYREPVARVPSHRYLAIRRGEREGMLRLSIEVDVEPLRRDTLRRLGAAERSPFLDELRDAVDDALARLVIPAIESDVRVEVKERADRAAVDVFASNLESLLLASPLGERSVVGIDPGLRTGCKCAVIDATGKLLAHRTIYPGQGTRRRQEAAAELVELVRRHRPFAIAVGNGTGGRETEAFARRALADASLQDVIVVPVNEAGASVYSASDVAREEFPDLDLTVRGAVSIGRRLQDPLAELVKIDPKSIGVGQYQHDVHQPLLRRKLDEVVESCVNRVGVELNTASAPLLARVAGIGPQLARRIVEHRDHAGAFPSRDALRQVKGVGPKAFEQAAGFLRIRGGSHPLDATAVHPERYGLVERMASDCGVAVEKLVGDADLAGKLDLGRYVGDDVGEPTLRDIAEELRRPGRDPREEFEPPKFRDDVLRPEDLEPGMMLEGIVTNVTDFGAFVDVGVHQDGLVHVSELSDRFVESPSDVVRAGDRLKVRVVSVDLERKRISLSARSGARSERGSRRRKEKAEPRGGGDRRRRPEREGGPRGAGKRAGSPKSAAPRAGARKQEPRVEESFEDKLAALKRKFNTRD